MPFYLAFDLRLWRSVAELRTPGAPEALRRARADTGTVAVGSAGFDFFSLVRYPIEGAADQVTADLFQGYLESMATEKMDLVKVRKNLDIVLKRF